MNKRIYILLSLIIVSLLIITAILYSKNKSFDNRINTISKSIEHLKLSDSTFVKQEAYKAQFKEDYYIQQQSNDTTLILCVFGFVVIIFGYLSYNSFIHQVDIAVNRLKADYDTQIKKYDAQEQRLLDLISEFYRAEAERNFEYANTSLIGKQYDWYVHNFLCGLSYYAKRVEVLKEIGGMEVLIESIVKISEDRLINSIDNLDVIRNIPNLKDSLIRGYINDIKKLESIEVDKRVMSLYSRLT
jgi:hypothetical protein